MRKFIDIITESEIDKSFTPPAYEVSDAKHYDTLRKTGFFGANAAGALVMAKTTGRVMLVLRSGSVEQPYTYGNCGGAFDIKIEIPANAAKRETREETGYTGKITMIPLLLFQKPGFKYYNFLAIVDDEFVPHLGWEADDYVWTNLGMWPKPLHFGMVALFDDAASMTTIKHYSSMFKNGRKIVDEDIDLPSGVNVADAISKAQDAKNDALKPPINGAQTPAQSIQPTNGTPVTNTPQNGSQPSVQANQTPPVNGQANNTAKQPVTNQPVTNQPVTNQPDTQDTNNTSGTLEPIRPR